MVARVKSSTLVGIDAVAVDVEAQISSGLRRFSVVGLPDSALRESKERVRCAIESSGLSFPNRDVVVSLAPASLPKAGASFDLAIALSILIADGQINPESVQSILVIGELALDGGVKPVNGALATALLAKKERHHLLISGGNWGHVAVLQEVKCFLVSSLFQAVSFLRGEIKELPAPILSKERTAKENKNVTTFADVVGQHGAKRALEIAAAGHHNVLIVGPPGAGKSMLASRITSILPNLQRDEAIEVTKIYSAVDHKQVLGGNGLVWQRPFRSPHHTTSAAGVIGGGTLPIPGEVSLAHKGVLFLDEFPEFKRDVLEALRQPMEQGQVLISRAKLRSKFPADFILIAAMNPCPCGYYGTEGVLCKCSSQIVARYRAKVSGPILDRIDLQIWVPPVPISELSTFQCEDPTQAMREKVSAAREKQRTRYNSALMTNAKMQSRHLKLCCELNDGCRQVIDIAAKRLKFSARTYTRVLKVARTVADLDGSENIQVPHLAEALTFRLNF